MSRYIDAEWLLNFFVDIPNNFTLTIGNLRATVNEAPSIDIPHADDWEKYSERLWKKAYERGKADRPSGEWVDAEIPLESGDTMPIQVCNLCKTFYPLAYTGGGHHFCPNCGAKMKGADDEID